MVGFAARKLATLMAILLAAIFVTIQLLVSYHLVAVNWPAVASWASQVASSLSGKHTYLWSLLVLNFPYAGSFGVGFWLGFRKG